MRISSRRAQSQRTQYSLINLPVNHNPNLIPIPVPQQLRHTDRLLLALRQRLGVERQLVAGEEEVCLWSATALSAIGAGASSSSVPISADSFAFRTRPSRDAWPLPGEARPPTRLRTYSWNSNRRRERHPPPGARARAGRARRSRSEAPGELGAESEGAACGSREESCAHRSCTFRAGVSRSGDERPRRFKASKENVKSPPEVGEKNARRARWTNKKEMEILEDLARNVISTYHRNRGGLRMRGIGQPRRAWGSRRNGGPRAGMQRQPRQSIIPTRLVCWLARWLALARSPHPSPVRLCSP